MRQKGARHDPKKLFIWLRNQHVQSTILITLYRNGQLWRKLLAVLPSPMLDHIHTFAQFASGANTCNNCLHQHTKIDEHTSISSQYLLLDMHRMVITGTSLQYSVAMQSLVAIHQNANSCICYGTRRLLWQGTKKPKVPQRHQQYFPPGF